MTLLEIMIVLSILALVMGLVVGPKLMDRYRDSQRNVAKLTVHKFADQDYPVWAVAHPNEQCPKQLAELANKTETDPWGTAYAMHCGETAPPVTANVGFGASSAAEDRTRQTSDDIVSWD